MRDSFLGFCRLRSLFDIAASRGPLKREMIVSGYARA
jgi:hypothetical protein